MRISTLLAGASVLIATAACGPRQEGPAVTRDTLPGGIPVVHNLAPSGWRDSTGIQFTEMVRLPTGDSGQAVLVNPGFFAVLDGSGRAYVVDQDPTRIKVFDSMGTYLRTIGRDGAGPGEYRSPEFTIHGPRLYVQDARQNRLSLFDTSGSFLSSFSSDRTYGGPDVVSVDDSGRIYLRFADSEHPDHAVTLLRFDSLGNLLDTLWLQQSHAPAVWVVDGPGSHATYGIPGAPTELVAITGTGAMLRGWSANYALALQPDGRDTTQLFTRAWTPITVPEAERTQRFAKLAEVYSRMLSPGVVSANFHLYDMPTVRPPMRSVRADPSGRIWVRIASADSTVALYDQFSDAGIWQGTVRAPWPGSAYVTWWGRDRVLVRETDENGLGHFVIYRMRRVTE